MPQMFPIPVTVIVMFIMVFFMTSLVRVYWHYKSHVDLEFKLSPSSTHKAFSGFW